MRKLTKTGRLLVLLCSTFSLHANAVPVAITGWPFPKLAGQAKPPASLGKDPVLGRLICPALSRLNLSSKRSEGLVVEEVTSGPNESGRFLWKFRLRSGIFWWNGNEVTAAEVKDFFLREIEEIAKIRGAGLWKVPAHSVSIDGRDVEISWSEPPVFGPFIFDGTPFWRKKPNAEVPYECVGIFTPKSIRPGVVRLDPSLGYKQRIKSSVFVARSDSMLPASVKRKLSFVSASELSLRGPAKARQPLTCRVSMDLPLFTVILWNTKSPMTKSAQVRQTLTGMIPRGALLRVGAGSFGRLSTGIISGTHSGYNTGLRLYPFSIDAAEIQLDKLGWHRLSNKDFLGDRMKDGKPVVLRMHVKSSKNPLVEQVITDSFATVGLATKWSNSDPKGSEWEGYLSGLAAPSPDFDYLSDLHSLSRGKEGSFMPSLGLKSLDQSLEGYSLSLTYGKPDFDRLKEVHKLLYKEEPFTVLMQHRACLKSTGTRISTRGLRVNQNDPDWFRKLLYKAF